MTHDFDVSQIDLNEIEREARRLRAKALRDGFVAFGAWLRAHRNPWGQRTA